ncbi:NAD(P)-dependent oxidoreductase [Candidatus Woesearchaeota archaeon]|nr:MAG: NAD(P)-dependent oxidoreductase [Candidatus Woesearchaeota archaeon]
MKKIVVTGGAGMVGQNLIPLLIKKQYLVIALDKNKNNLYLLKELNPDVEICLCDLSKTGNWQKLFSGAYAVVDLKAQIASKQESLFYKNNIKAQKNILQACKRHNIGNLVHASSSVVISVGKDHYTKTKTSSELLVHKSSVPHSILRPTLMYGCFDVKHLGWIASLMEKTPVLPIPGSGRFIRQPLYVIDFCNIILRCLDMKPKNEVYNIVGLEKIAFRKMLDNIAKERKFTCVIVPFPVPLFRLLLKAYAWMLRRPTITADQLDALLAGDEFPVKQWNKTFKVPYTSFKKGIRYMYQSPNYQHSKRMISPH